MPEDDSRKAVNGCLFCLEGNKECDGRKPQCDRCLRSKETCTYKSVTLKPRLNRTASPSPARGPKISSHSLNNDKRRRKYHTDYIDSLENKTAKLEHFIRQFSKNDETLAYINDKLDSLKYEDDNKTFTTYPQDKFDFKNIIDDLDELKIRDDTTLSNSNPFRTQLQEAVDVSALITGINQGSFPVSLIGNTLFIRDVNYQPYILQLFKQNFAIISPALIRLVSILETVDYNSVEEPLTLKLMFDVVLGIGNAYSALKDKEWYENYFISKAKDSLMQIICRSRTDIYLISACFLLSCYEFSQNHISQAYIYDGIACSLTQHMGLHISYSSKMGEYGPKQSPFNLAMLWTICSHDRLITAYTQVPSVIHYKRIISPIYQVITPADNLFHIPELAFSYISRLFYIFDRYSDQILTVNYDIGDTDNKYKLLSMGSKSLEELKNTLPDALQLESINGSPNDLFILCFHINYHIAILRLNRAAIKDSFSSVIKRSIIKHLVKVCELLIQLNREDLIDRAPYYIPSVVHFVALLLVLFIVNRKDSPTTLSSLQVHFSSLRRILVRTSGSWRLASEDFITNLDNLEHKYGLLSQSSSASGEGLPSASDENEVAVGEPGTLIESFPEMENFFKEWDQRFPQIDTGDYRNNPDDDPTVNFRSDDDIISETNITGDPLLKQFEHSAYL